ncbi:hypothetical protein ElyMa_004765900 [Elysia marginata]|uniref:Uncharacterized protein n=1 Tax=Elysia marginata TaxID=1093978 RepID=A0AAV4II03_9GAST|nr:hypothetical protein ElyMa_004765900 [Elysia marginata]
MHILPTSPPSSDSEDRMRKGCASECDYGAKRSEIVYRRAHVGSRECQDINETDRGERGRGVDDVKKGTRRELEKTWKVVEKLAHDRQRGRLLVYGLVYTQAQGDRGNDDRDDDEYDDDDDDDCGDIN